MEETKVHFIGENALVGVVSVVDPDPDLDRADRFRNKLSYSRIQSLYSITYTLKISIFYT
jgi:hypothetical protein